MSLLKPVLIKYCLFLILSFSFFVNFYKLSETPPSLSWDEASVGYDAYAITKDGKDQWGDSYPIAFRSFEEYKYPFHIYTTSLFIKLFGLSEFAVRAPAVLFGVINVLLLFFLVRLITKNKYVAILSALFLSITPWFIHFSRVNWETNFALCFFLIGLLLFYLGIYRKSFLLILSLIFFGLDLYTYNAAKIFVPLLLLFLIIIYRKELCRIKCYALFALIAFLVVLSFNLFNSRLSGLTRFEQVSFDDAVVRKTSLYTISKNHYLGRLEIILKQYLIHFNVQFLFISGDKNPRHSSQMTGELYWIDLLLLPVGLYFLIRSKEKYRFLFLAWFFLAPLPAAFTKEVPHASRAMFTLGGWQVVSAIGTYYFVQKIRNKLYQKIFIVVLALIIFISIVHYLYTYFYIYSPSYAQEWQYSYKKFFDKYQSRFWEFDNILISDRYNQPYIFALFYLKYDPAKFRSEVKYNNTIRRRTSLVRSFDKFTFRDIDYYQIPPGKNLIFTHITDKMDEIKWKEAILNPDGSVGGYVYEYTK